MQPEAYGLTHSRLCGSILLVDDFYKYPCLPSVSDIHSTPKAKSSVQISPSKLLSILYGQEEVLYRERSVPRVQISQSSEVRYSAGRFEELSRSGRRFCLSPDQSVEACQFLHDEAEVMSNSRSAQSSPVKLSIGFWLSLLRSTSCLSPRTL
ncbi:hypothetical protein DY000_02024382 [Brassica cretica]|uniref:Uncharacterized protein n=1 Tax=Brassica cretica TaxID=69181 RepID=A0ABQ7ECD6_BRACR|nr:hypothetical protein DY000_02024382 [Brassica cretica]